MQKLQIVQRSEREPGDDRVSSIVNDLAEKMAGELGYSGEENLLLSDPEIFAKLEKEAEEIIHKEEEAKHKAEEKRRADLLLAAKRRLGIIAAPVRDIKLALELACKNEPSAWQEYMKTKGENFLPPVFNDGIFNSSLAVSAARGKFLGCLKYHRKNPSWIRPEMEKANKIWTAKCQALLDKIHGFFKDGDYPRTSQGLFSEVAKLLEAEPQLRWFFDGPKAIKEELDKAEAAKAAADEKALAQRQEELARQGRKNALLELLLGSGISLDEAEKLSRAVAKKFPQDSPEQAIANMAVLRQAESALWDGRYLAELAPEAEPYYAVSGMKFGELMEKVRQHPSVAVLQKRNAKNFGEMKSTQRKPQKKGKK